MKKQNKNVSWTPFTDIKETSAIVDNELPRSKLGVSSKEILVLKVL